MDSKSEKFLKSILDNIEQGSFRHKVLETAKRFKSNWFELGEKLTEVANKKMYEEWGYKTFEDYCRLEIRIRTSTAMKLTNAYFFLKNETPEKQWGFEEEHLPDLKSVQILEKAKNNEYWTPEVYEEFKKTALGDTVSEKNLTKKYNEIQKSFNIEEEILDWKKPLQNTRQLKSFLEGIHAKDKWLETLNEIETYLNQKQNQPEKSDRIPISVK